MNQDCEKKNKAPKLSNDLGPKDTGEGLSDSNFTTKDNFRLIFMRGKEERKYKKLGDMAFQKFGGKVSLDQAPSLAHGPPSPAVAMTISPAFSILTTAMSTLMKIIFLLFLLCHLIMT